MPTMKVRVGDDITDIDPATDPEAYKRLLGDRYDEETRRRQAADDEERWKLQSSGQGAFLGDPTFARMQQEGAMGRNGFNRQWVPFFEAFNQIGENTGKKVKWDTDGLAFTGADQRDVREGKEAELRYAAEKAQEDLPNVADRSKTWVRQMGQLPLSVQTLTNQAGNPFDAPMPTRKERAKAAQAAQSQVQGPVVQGPTVSGPRPLREQPLQPMQQPNQPRSSSGGGGGTGSPSDYSANGRLKTIPRPWVPGENLTPLPSKSLLAPDSLMSLIAASRGGTDVRFHNMPVPSSLNALQQQAAIPSGGIASGVMPMEKAAPADADEAASPIADPDQSTGSLIRAPRPWKPMLTGGY